MSFKKLSAQLREAAAPEWNIFVAFSSDENPPEFIKLEDRVWERVSTEGHIFLCTDTSPEIEKIGDRAVVNYDPTAIGGISYRYKSVKR